MSISKIKINFGSVSIYYFTIILIWIVAFFFLLAFQVEEENSISISKTDNLKNMFWSGIIAGVIWGSIFKIARSVRQYLPNYFLTVLLSISVNIISAYLLIYTMYHLGDIFNMDDFPETFSQLIALYNSQVFYAILAYFFIVGSLIEILYEMDLKLGRGTLIKFLLGQYYRPKEEERIFLFMDLKSSTYYAEKLGHFKYSRLIQDCFKDISYAVAKNHAQIYQFVGDEVVLTWKLKNGIKKLRCIKVFHHFMEVLDKKKDYYQKHYGMVPVFKAGVHSGKVMVAEVGEMKSEIAYHGDAINTASRIQGLCNSYNSRLLISGNLLNELQTKNQLNCCYQHLGEVLLTGKEISTDLYSIRMN